MNGKWFHCLIATALVALGLAPANASVVLPTDVPASHRLCTDYVIGGVGAMRWPDSWTSGPTTATIQLGSGLSVNGSVPVKAYLYWLAIGPQNRDTNGVISMFGTGAALTTAERIAFTKPMTVNGQIVPDANIKMIGEGYGDNWPGSLGSYAYRADVSAMVTNPNGQVVLSGFAPTCEGATLIVFYSDGNDSNNRNLYLFEGNDSNALGHSFDSDGLNASLSGFTYRGNGGAKLILSVADTQQTKVDGALTINALSFLPFGNNFNGNSVAAAMPGSAWDFDYEIRPGNSTGGRLWDVRTFDQFESWLPVNAPAGLLLQSSPVTDFWNLVLAIVDLPSSNVPGDCEGSVVVANATPQSQCPAPLTIEANLVDPLPAVTLTASFTDAESDPLTVQWYFASSPGAPLTLLRTDSIVFAPGQTSYSTNLTFSGLAPQSANRITISVTDNKPGHAPTLCDVGITTIEPAAPTLDPGAPIVVTADSGDGQAALPDFQGYYAVQPTPAGGFSITGWDNHSRSLSTLLMTQFTAPGTRFPVGLWPITIGLKDEALNSTSGIKYFDVRRAPGNRPPVAAADARTIRAGQSVTIPVLANDTDVDADPLALVLGSVAGLTANGGTVIANANGTIGYLPAPGFVGVDTFSYSVVDQPPQGETPLTATGSVSITVINNNTPPVAVPDSFTTAEDVALSIPFATLLLNDTDADNDLLTVSGTVSSGPTHGTLALTSSGWVYTPAANYNGPDSFSYTVLDGFGGTSTALVSLTVTPVNDPPVAVDDSGSTSGSEITISILSNDSDLDGDPLTVSSFRYLGSNADVRLNPDGTLIYVPGATFVGTDLVEYTVSDGRGGFATALVRIVVRGGGTGGATITAADDSYTIDEDAAPLSYLDIPISALFANDSSSNGTFHFASNTGVSHGELALVTTGPSSPFLRYSPARNYNGSDSFTYTFDNGAGGTATATVRITINPVNDACVAIPDSITIAEDSGPVLIAVLANDYDVDQSDVLSLTAVSILPAHGVVRIAGNQIEYTPNPNFNGVDVFSYVIDSTDGSAATADVRVTVLPRNDPPTIPNGNETTVVNQPITRPLLGADIDGDTLFYTVLSGNSPTHGSVVLNSDGTYTYTPSTGYSGTDSFKVTVFDGRGGVATATIVIRVYAAPIANPDTASTQQGVAVVIPVLSNDTDPDALPLPLSVASLVAPSGGVALINTNNTITYTPTVGFFGSDSFVYTITDGASTAAATVTVFVNAPPTANDASITTPQNTSFTGTLTGSDPNGDTLTFGPATLVTAHGTVAINPDGTYTYTPASGYSGADSFNFTVSDGRGGAAAAGVVQITVTPSTSGGCDLYPIALHISNVNSTPIGGTLDIYSGANPGNFGWLSWGGSQAEPTLVTSLTVPGDSYTYVNPYNSADHVVSVGDYVQGDTGIVNGSEVRNRLDILKTIDITVPVWDIVRYNGNNTVYHVAAFARVRITKYDLPRRYISATFLGLTQCGGGTPPPPANRAPIANRDTASVNEDQAATISVLSNDSDPDGDSISVVSATTPAHGSATVNANGTITYTPAANYNGADTFRYTITDGSLTASSTVTINVCAVNDAPIANDQAKTTFKDVAVNGKVTGSDVDNDPLSFGPVGRRLTLHGAVDLLASGSYVYVPATGYVGNDSFSFTVADGRGGVDSGVVTISVVEPPTTPNCDIHPIVVHEDCFKGITSGRDIEISGGSDSKKFGWACWDGTPNEVKLCTSLSARGDSDKYRNPYNSSDRRLSKGDWVGGSTSCKNSATLRGQLDDLKGRDITVPVWSQADTRSSAVLYKVSKFARVRIVGYNLSGNNRLTVKFLGYDDCGSTAGNLAPIARIDNASTTKNTPVTINVLSNDTDPNGDILTIATVTNPGSGSAQIVNGKILYSPASNFVGRATFSYTIIDGHGGSAAATVVVCVTSPTYGGDGTGCHSGWDNDDEDDGSCRRNED